MRISDWSSDVCSSYLVQSASDDLQTLHAYWRAGDAEAIWDEMGADMRDRYPKLYRHINVERNDAWVPKIEQMLAEPGTDDTLVVVGALHLLGEDGVVEKLRAKGHAGDRICSGCVRSGEHTSELKSLMSSSYADVCLKKRK